MPGSGSYSELSDYIFYSFTPDDAFTQSALHVPMAESENPIDFRGPTSVGMHDQDFRIG